MIGAAVAAATSHLPTGGAAPIKDQDEVPPEPSYSSLYSTTSTLSLAAALFGYLCLPKVFRCCRQPPKHSKMYIMQHGGTYHPLGQ